MRTQYFELAGEKFWEVWVAGTDLYTRHGKVGANGQVKIKSFATAADAKAHQKKVIADKTKEGYAAPGAPAQAAANTDALPPGTQRLELDGATKRFWQVRVQNGTLTIQFGKVGTAGQTQTKRCKDNWAAMETMNELLAEKKRKGYVPVLVGKQAASSSVARSPALEKAIYAHPESDDGFMVYADYLQQQGDIRGELAAIQAQLATDPKDKKLRAAEQKLRWEHRAHFYGPLAVYLQKKKPESPAVLATWRQGWMDSLELSAIPFWLDDAGVRVDDVAELVRVVPEVASAKFLRELILGKPVAEDEYDYSAAVEALVKVLPRLPMLRRLTIGKFEHEDSELSWSRLGKLDALWPVAKQLEYLRLRAGSMTLGTVDAPNLRELRIETGGLTRNAIASLVTARLPKLETLAVWFGQRNYGFDAEVADLLPFLDKRTFPKVKHLAIANTIFGDELAEHWPTATILPQLETLDLSRSHLTVAGVRKLAAHAGAFAHLRSLDLSECLLDKHGVKLARTLCANVPLKDQQRELGNWRYTAVGE